MGVKLYGMIDSPSTMRALASIYEHDLQFQFIPIDLNAGDHKTDHFLSLNPFGQIPVLEDDELIIFESRTIMRYISHHYPEAGKEQIFMAPKLQGIAACWIDVEDHKFDPPASKLWFELISKPKNGQPPNDTVVAEEEVKLAAVLDVYEERLSESKYLGGDKFTSADLTHLPMVSCLMATSVRRLFDERRFVGAWCRNILARPGWENVVKMVTENKSQ